MAERNGIILLPVMGIAVPGGIEIHRLFQGSLSIISEETPSRKTPSSIALAALPDGAKDDVSYAFSNLAIEDVLPDNRDLVLKPWYKVDERACGSHTGQPRRLFPRTEWYPLLRLGVKDTVAQCNSLLVPWTVQGAWHQTVVASRFTVRLLIQSARDRSTRGVEAAGTMSGHFVECDHVTSAEYSLDVFGCRLRIHPRDTLPCALTVLKSTMAENNGDTDGVATLSSCIWRLHARFSPTRVDGRTAVCAPGTAHNDDSGQPSSPASPHVWLPPAQLHLVTAAAAQRRQALHAALPPPHLRLSMLSR
ncbi:uncharacterized protein LOC142570394 [Dermacentor variabilis]|uniref:uncharacterized protein LOC142570394 n=1 Tax=Dermacentor variabilis TaxID=34621 RepID=UPI003F5AE0EB